MSELDGSGAAPEIVSDDSLEVKKSPASGGDKVSHETYKRTVSEVKRLKEQLKELDALKSKLTEHEQNEQMRVGKHEETIASLRSDLDRTKKAERATFQKYAFKSLSAQVREEAMKHGCVDPAALIRLADLSEVEIDGETFQADHDKVVEIVSSMKSNNPYLFSKPGPKINDKLPAGGEVAESKGIDFKKMSTSEITEWLNKNR